MNSDNEFDYESEDSFQATCNICAKELKEEDTMTCRVEECVVLYHKDCAQKKYGITEEEKKEGVFLCPDCKKKSNEMKKTTIENINESQKVNNEELMKVCTPWGGEKFEEYQNKKEKIDENCRKNNYQKEIVDNKINTFEKKGKEDNSSQLHSKQKGINKKKEIISSSESEISEAESSTDTSENESEKMIEDRNEKLSKIMRKKVNDEPNSIQSSPFKEDIKSENTKIKSLNNKQNKSKNNEEKIIDNKSKKIDKESEKFIKNSDKEEEEPTKNNRKQPCITYDKVWIKIIKGINGDRVNLHLIGHEKDNSQELYVETAKIIHYLGRVNHKGDPLSGGQKCQLQYTIPDSLTGEKTELIKCGKPSVGQVGFILNSLEDYKFGICERNIDKSTFKRRKFNLIEWFKNIDQNLKTLDSYIVKRSTTNSTAKKRKVNESNNNKNKKTKPNNNNNENNNQSVVMFGFNETTKELAPLLMNLSIYPNDKGLIKIKEKTIEMYKNWIKNN